MSFYPWSRVFIREVPKSGHLFVENLPGAGVVLGIVDILTRWREKTQWPAFGPPLPLAQKMYYPIAKAHNETNVTTLRAAEKCLDRFWADVDQTYKEEKGCSLHDCFQQVCNQQRTLRRTAPWKSTAPRIAPQSVLREIGQRISSLGLQEEKPTRFISESPRTKQKTTGIPDAARSRKPNEMTPSLETGTESEEKVQHKIKVSARAMVVFDTMIHTRRHEVQKGELEWKEILHALTSAGFAAEKLYGSAWQFTPDREKVGNYGNISLHEPHPDPKVPFHMARAMGKRFSRKFDWSGETFTAN